MPAVRTVRPSKAIRFPFTDDDVLAQRGTLILGHEYHIDVAPFDSTLTGELRVANGPSWEGPPEYEAPLRGAVRFMPINSELALRNAVWIFTDANIGCSRLNAIILDAPARPKWKGGFTSDRDNFWIESLESGNGIAVDDYELKPRRYRPRSSTETKSPSQADVSSHGRTRVIVTHPSSSAVGDGFPDGRRRMGRPTRLPTGSAARGSRRRRDWSGLIDEESQTCSP